MIYLLYIETKGLVKQFLNSLSLKNGDYLIGTIFLLTITSILKILQIFNVDINYIMIGMLVVSIAIAMLDNSKLIIKLFESKNYIFTKVYPINEYKIVTIKVLKYDIISFIQFFILMIPLTIIIILVGYDLLVITKAFIFSIATFIFSNGFISIFNIYKSQFENKVIKIIINSILVAIPYMFIYYSAKVFSLLIDLIDRKENISTFNMKSLNVINISKDLIQINYFSLLIIMSLAILIIRIYSYMKISEKYKKNFKKEKIKKISNINIKNIIIRKEIYGLLNEKGIYYLIDRLISYGIFGIVFMFVNTKLNINIQANLLFIILMYEIALVSEKLTENYLGKEGDFAIQYIYSNYSILKIIAKRTVIYVCIAMIYLTLMEIIISTIFNLNIYDFIINLIISILFTISFITTCNIFNTYKSSYKNELGIPNKKVSFIKMICETSFCYLSLPVITFIPFIDGIKYKGLIIIVFITIISFIYVTILNIFAKLKEGEFYGEFKGAFSKR